MLYKPVYFGTSVCLTRAAQAFRHKQLYDLHLFRPINSETVECGILVKLVHLFFGKLVLKTPDFKRLPRFAKKRRK